METIDSTIKVVILEGLSIPPDRANKLKLEIYLPKVLDTVPERRFIDKTSEEYCHGGAV